MIAYYQVHQQLKQFANSEKAICLKKFFKTEKGGYGENDQFLGITVPHQRMVANMFFKEISLDVLKIMLQSKWHEDRLTALYMLILKYNKNKDYNYQATIIDTYIKHIDSVNNWDLVDSSAAQLLGNWLYDKNKSILYEFATENHLWKNRIAIVSCHYFIKKHDITDIIKITTMLLHHPHDLIHKALGWMLREAWKKNALTIESFILNNYTALHRTALRYAIETMPEKKRQEFLHYKQK